jgi:uncharacterized protein with NRDE domain
MCLAVVALRAHPDFALVVAANRDEFHARSAAPASWWDADVLAGRDLEAGGTWLGVNRRGRWAFVTNVREPARHDPAAPSRGALVPRLLADLREPQAALAAVGSEGARYNGYNLIAGVRDRAAWASNRAVAPRVVPDGITGVSNALLDTPWPKLERSKAAVAAWAAAGERDLDPLFAALADRSLAPDAQLPATGLPLDRERMLSAAFIVSPRYGTRCSTILAITHDGAARFVERSFDPEGRALGQREFRFALEN